MVGADVVLGGGQIDAGLAAVGGIDLGDERRGDVHDGHAALVGGGAEPGEVADDATAERDEVIGAGHAGGGELTPHALGARERLVGLARRDHDRARRGENLSQPLGVQRRDGLIADEEGPGAGAIERPDLGEPAFVA